MAATAPQASIPLAEALGGVADELRRLGAMGERVQDTLSPLILGSTTVMAEAQALDRIVQYAHDLAAFVERCGQACPPEWRLDSGLATADLKLSELADRLGGSSPSPTASRSATPAPIDAEADAGAVELW